MYNNKKIFILGMARSGYEAAKLLASKNALVVISDMKEQDPEHIKELEQLGVLVYIGTDPLELIDETFDYIVKNPGIKLDHPLCLKANELNIPVINEVEVAYNYLPNVKIIGITGSNGKTTTTTIIYNILKEAGLPVHLGGNIGYPVCSLVDLAKDEDILVLEISGHQLHDTKNFKTDISVMTNLSEVHLDHFKTYENYIKNKCLIFRHHTFNDLAILNKDNKDVINNTNNILSRKIFFSSKQKTDLYIKDNFIYYNEEPIINISDIKVKGMHNYENIMCAIAVVKEFLVTNEIIKQVLSNFGGVNHRIEFVAKINNRSFYNDSKATNVESTQIALSSFNEPTILLLGGLDRGHSFVPLKEYLKNTKLVIAYGETKDRIKEFCDSININCLVVDTLLEATTKAYDKSNIGDIILLSPACASWDQYSDFEARGDHFKEIINNLQ